MRTVLVLLLAALLIIGCSQEPTSTVEAQAPSVPGTDVPTERAASIRDATSTLDGKRIAAADAEPGNWLAHGRTYDEQRYSPLDDINNETVADLSLAWYWDTGSMRGLEATPIVVDGVMFTSGAWSTVHANDAKTGELIWSFDPKVPKEWGRYACCDVVNRGVAVWKGRVYVGTIDGRLVAIDAATGTLDWVVLTIDPERPYTITGAPRVIKDMVVIGNGGAEYGVRGYVSAYDTQTGAQKWRFYTVPGDPSKPFESRALELAAPTWRGGKWWEVGGGGTVWDSMAYDPELDLLYVGVGNGSPWNRYIRSPGGGDNLYLSSIVAIDPDNGTMAWYYQTTPGDTWDYTATQHMILADLEIDGIARKVIVQAPKNGFFYVIDRTDGRFITAEAYVPMNWASYVDPESGRPVENPDAHYANETQTIFPGPLGGHNWHPMSFSPDTGLVYIPALETEFTYAQDNAFKYAPGEWNLGVSFDAALAPVSIEDQIAAMKRVRGHLAAWDPIAQKEIWRVQHAMTWNGGLLSTGGNLVFQGRADGMFAAYTADTGELVWEVPVHTGIIAPPVTYAVDGEQYVAVVAGWGGAFGTTSGAPRHKGNVLEEGRILAFKLGGEAVLPEPRITHVNIPEPPAIKASEEQIAAGAQAYIRYCSLCHGAGVASGSQIPDLKYVSSETHAAWNAIVRDGVLAGRGMPGFGHVLTEDDAHNVHAYVISASNASIAFCESEYPKNYPELFGTACVKRVVE